jgi:hypothetical protein
MTGCFRIWLETFEENVAQIRRAIKNIAASGQMTNSSNMRNVEILVDISTEPTNRNG